MSENENAPAEKSGPLQFEKMNPTYHDDERTTHLLRRAQERNETVPETRRFEDFLRRAANSSIVRVFAGLLRLTADIVGAIAGKSGRGLRIAGERIEEIHGVAEEYYARFKRRLGGGVMIYQLKTEMPDDAHPGTKALGLIFRKPRLVWRVHLTAEIAGAAELPAIVVGRFDCISILHRGRNILARNKFRVRIRHDENGDWFKQKDEFGSKLTLCPEAGLLLLALQKDDRISLSELTHRALAHGEDAERLSLLIDKLRSALTGTVPPPLDEAHRAFPVFVRKRWPRRIAVIRDREPLHIHGKIRVKLIKREFGEFFRILDSFGNRLTLPEGTAMVLLSFHKEGRINLSSLVTRATHQGANALIQAELRADLITALRIKNIEPPKKDRDTI